MIATSRDPGKARARRPRDPARGIDEWDLRNIPRNRERSGADLHAMHRPRSMNSAFSDCTGPDISTILPTGPTGPRGATSRSRSNPSFRARAAEDGRAGPAPRCPTHSASTGDAVVRGAGFDVDHPVTATAHRLQAAPEPLALVAADDDNTELILDLIVLQNRLLHGPAKLTSLRRRDSSRLGLAQRGDFNVPELKPRPEDAVAERVSQHGEGPCPACAGSCVSSARSQTRTGTPRPPAPCRVPRSSSGSIAAGPGTSKRGVVSWLEGYPRRRSLEMDDPALRDVPRLPTRPPGPQADVNVIEIRV